MLRIDLHVHSSERSPCGQSPMAAMVEGAIIKHLDALIFTDHDRLTPRAQLQNFNQRYAPFRVYGGIEVTVGSEHVLVFGIHDPALESGDWNYQELHRFVRERNGFLALAHPYRYHEFIDLELEAYPPDAIEAYSWNTPRHAASHIIALARLLGITILANSDAHHVERLGIYYNILNSCLTDERAIIDALRSGDFLCHTPNITEEITGLQGATGHPDVDFSH